MARSAGHRWLGLHSHWTAGRRGQHLGELPGAWRRLSRLEGAGCGGLVPQSWVLPRGGPARGRDLVPGADVTGRQASGSVPPPLRIELWVD